MSYSRQTIITRIYLTIFILLAIQFISFRSLADTVVWNFTTLTSAAASSSNVNVPASGCTASIGNSLGTVATPINTTSASSGYTGATGTGNIGNAVKLGSYSSSISSYISFTLTPNTGYSITITGISFGSRSTGTGPQGFTIATDIDAFAATDASGTLPATSSWALYNPAFSSVTGAANTAVQLRIYGYNGAGSPGSGTENWRIDDITITYTANPISACSGTPLAGIASPSVMSICGSGASSLSLIGGTAAAGITYQWSSSNTNTPPGSNISAATSSSYVAAGISSTTYYWCTTTCTTSSLSSISSVGVVTVNPTPTINVSPSTADICSGGSGASLLASGANTYSWSPISGLSASTGSSLTANPSAGIIYSVTGTNTSTGCVGSSTVAINYYPSPSSISIAPLALNVCAGSGTNLITASGGLLGPTTLSSGTINAVCNAASTAFPNSLSVNGIPAGAIITDISVTVNFTSSYLHDYIINLKAPNNSVLNLMGQHTPSGAGGSYTSTTISSAVATALSTSSTPYTGTFAADAGSAIGGGGYASTVTTFPSLYSIPNGSWTLIPYNTYASSDVSSLVSWSITLNYTFQAPVTWATTTNLFTDASGTIPYAGASANSVYENPLVAGVITYTATATNSGCTSASTVTSTVTPLPTAISGVKNVCSGLATTLSDAITSGTWSSGNTIVASVDPLTGIVTGGTAGNTIISFSNGCAPDATATVTVLTAPAIMPGTASVCSGSNITLSNSVTGGTWSTSSTSIATVGSGSGVVTGGIVGTAAITYSTGCGTDVTTTITTIAAPGVMLGAAFVCSGSNITLSNSVNGGTWSTSSTGVATVGSGTGVVTGGIAGNATITYSTGCGTDATTTVTTRVAPGAISGASMVCSGSNLTLSNSIAGGTWNTSSTSIATVGSGSGIVTGGIAGTVVIKYSTGCGTDATKTITVIAPPGTISGASTVCAGLNITLSNASASGTWSSSSTTIATVGSGTGIVTGGTPGTVVITYSTGCGTAATASVTTMASPGVIAGASTVCSGLNITLSDGAAGGSWSSSNTNVATIGTGTGIVTGGIAGNAVISYSTGCGTDATKTITVLAAPGTISGATIVCSTSIITLSNSTTSGTWSSSSTTTATVGSGTGIVTGVIAGNAVISYSTGCGSAVTTTITVIGAPGTISGASSVCSGSNITLSDATAGGTWSTNNTSVATVGTSSGVVTGGVAGNATITYSTGCGIAATKTITVIAAPGTISGSNTVCSGLNITLSDGTASGTWSSSNSAIASVVAGTGVVTGGTAGNAVITYSTGCGSAATTTVTVIAAPSIISGPSSVCEGLSITLSDATVGGTWSSSNTSVGTVGTLSGIVTGGVAGNATMTYSTGCGANATKIINVIAAPGSISGASTVCSGLNITLSDGTASGTWSSSNSTVASVVSGTGVVTGGSAGNAVITYSTGCGSAATATVTVMAAPGAISGASSVCEGLNITLSNATVGGTWSSNNTSVATVGTSSGIVTGSVAGTTTMIYSTGCGINAIQAITVIAAPGSISGASTVCSGLNITLSDGTASGTWSSSNSLVASVVSGTGLVTGGVRGTATIAYSTGCGSDATMAFIVNSVPAAPNVIIGAGNICNGSSIILSDMTVGGAWSSSNTSIATIDGSGNVTSVSGGATTISYTLTNICGSTAATAILQVELPLTPPTTIVGITSVCAGATTSLSDMVSGGVWSSDNTAIAVSGVTGIITGVSAGSTVISYTIGNSCGYTSTSVPLTVNPLPSPSAIIAPATTFCAGTRITLSDATPGGSWSSNITTVATVSNTGVVYGVYGGRSTIYYSITNGCGTVPVSVVVTVDSLPVLGNLSGVTSVCIGATTMLSDTASVGVWSSGTISVATVNNTGLVTGVGAGVATISYSVTNTCGTAAATAVITVNAIPIPGPINGIDSVCPGHMITLSDNLAGGTWSSDFPAVANINSLGVVTGMNTGIDTIRYSIANSCGSAMVRIGFKVLSSTSTACGGLNAGPTLSPGSSQLKLYPNPNTGTFTMDLVSESDEFVEVVISNVVGEKIYEFTTTTNKENNIALIRSAGIYFLSAKTSHGTSVAKFVIAY